MMTTSAMTIRMGLVAALSAGIGLAAGHLLGRADRQNAQEQQEALQREVASLKSDSEALAVAKRQLATLRNDLTVSQDALAAALAPKAAAATADEEEGAEAAVDPKRAFSDMIMRIGQAQLKGQIEGRLGVLKDRLQLSPDQEARVKQILDAESAEATAALDRLLSGQGTPADFGRLARLQRGQLPDGIDAVMTGTQQADYAAFKEQERVSSVENRVAMELSGLVAAGGLTPEQKDDAFASLSGVVMAEDATNFDSMRDTSEVRAFMDEATQRRLELMEPILTGPQLQMYQQQVEMGRQVISNLMPAEQP